ncbi:MAG: DNA polymerase III subunit alpha [Acidobacteria bacterium]|nr:error-prone DNA polymerase [Acidobacteriota bacterium]MXW71889.1 DNA polymerase III subunit alpha [Acidobacteriota bacterium]MYE44008.1 DNA polymerase III subunit alpha [Acidobacteriota bacterium]
MYFPLYCKSNASFLEGASHPEELVEEAHSLGLPGIALTDRNGLYGAVKAHVAARERGIRLVLGAETSVAADTAGEGRQGAPESILLLVRNRTGYRNLCRLLTRGLLRDPDPVTGEDSKRNGSGTGRGSSRKGTAGVSWEEIAGHAEGLHALWGGGASALKQAPPPDRPARLLREAFGENLHVLITRHHRDDDMPEEARLRGRANRYRIPVAAATEVLYHRPGRREMQDVLTAIRYGVPLREAGRRLRGNAEHYLRSPALFRELFADDPAAVDRTLEISEACRFSLDELRYRYPAEELSGGMDSDARLRELTFEGAAERYPGGMPPAVRQQLEKELELIHELDYGGYFLTMVEIVRFCREREILCQGRGSAANSAVCFCLGITAVDPVRMGLLFERFLSRERAEPPDIDLDIMHSRREEVIQFVYQRYGEGRAAMVANTVCYRTRSAIRDVGKALGFSERSVDRLARAFSHYEPLSSDRLAAAGWTSEGAATRHFLRLANEIQGFPRHLSIHPGGFLLGEEPVSHIVPVENAAMEGRTVIQWNKDDIEELGLFKVDLLGLGALTQLDLAFRLLRESRNVDLSMSTIPADDPNTFAMIRKAATVGVFQIESRAQMAMLPRLQPENYYDLVIEVSIVRPGPIAGGMVHPYLRRRRGEEAVEYPHPSLRPVLEKTLGVPLFQEQVMRLAVVAADYTAGEADQLRRDMAAWRRTGRMERHRSRLLSRMCAKGIAPEFAKRVFEQIQGFGEYGFPESHAASFALISYAGAFLLCHYPAEFACALLNAQPMGFYSPATIIEDAKRRGVRFLPVDVTASAWDCSLFPGSTAAGGEGKSLPAKPDVRLGLRYVKGLGAADGEKIVAARRESPFVSIAALARRTGLDRKAMVALAEADALRNLGPKTRRAAVWQTLGVTPKDPPLLEEAIPGFAPLDGLETITWDHRTTGSSTRGHPLLPLRSRLAAAGLPSAREVSKLRNGTRARYAGIVICRQRPGTASGVVFMTLEDETGFVNLVLWPDVFEAHRQLAQTLSFLGAAGRIQAEQGTVHLVVDELFRPEIAETVAPPEVPSRDFH